MKFFINLIKGIFIGVANIIPGVSGGTMAVSLGLYDKMLSSISNLFKDFKNSIKFLIPVALGMGIGIGGFTFVLGWLIDNQPLATSLSFTGLILGGFPMLLDNFKEGWAKDTKKSMIVNIFLFVVFAGIVVGMALMNASGDDGSAINPSITQSAIAFVMGVIASATMIIPGVSGSLVMMVLGYYFGIIGTLKDFISALKDFDIDALLKLSSILVPFGIGCLIGIFFISKLIAWLFKSFCSATYAAIFGLIIASPFGIFYKVNQESPMGGTSVVSIIVGIVLLVVCTLVTYWMGTLETDKAPEDETEKEA